MLVSTFAAPGQADLNTRDSQEILSEALQLRQQGRFEETEALLLEAVRDEPSNADYHFELGNTYASLYDNWHGKQNDPRLQTILRASEHELKQAVMFRPGHTAARYNLGVIYKREGRYEDAREEFHRILEIQPGMPAALYQVGATYEAQGFYDEAKDAYLAAHEQSPDAPEIEEALERLRETQNESNRPGGQDFFNRRTSAFDQVNQRSQGGGLFNNNNDSWGGGSNSPFGNSSYNGSNQNQGQSALPSLASVLLQQVLARRSSNNSNNQ